MSLLSLVLLASSAASGVDVDVRTLAGQTVSGTLKELAADRVVVATSGGEQTLAAKELLGVSLRGQAATAAAKPQVWLDFIDGGHLVGLEFSAEKGEGLIKLVDGREVKLPTKAVSAVRLKEQNDKIAQQWQGIVSGKYASDVIIIRREEAIDFMEGVLGDVNAERVQFTVDGELINVKRPRVEGFQYFQAKAPDLPGPVCQVLLTDGSRLPAARLSLAGDELSITTLAGLELKQPLAGVKELDFSLGKLRYLSDMEWETIERHDYLATSTAKADRFYDPRKDTSFLGPLRLGSKTYSKGLALKSHTKLTYRLPGKYSRLVGLAGINAQMAPGGHLRLKISGDQQTEPLWDGVIAGGDLPHELSIDLTGVRRLTIEVDFGENGDSGDHLNLCDLRIIQ
jgi:hypothetical protein